MSFGKQIKSFNEKVGNAANNIIRGTSLSMFGKIVKRTPVDTGRAIGNWQLNVNRKPRSVIETTGDNKGSAATARATKNLDRAKIGDSVWIMNNLPYIEVLENGDESREPHGMVKITVAEYLQTVKHWADKEKV